MPWIRVDDHFNEHPKLAQVGPLGWGYWVAGLAYCNRNLTDGFIPRASAQSLGVFEVCSGELRYDICVTSGMQGDDVDAGFVIGLLLDAGLWYEVSGGYRVHDYLEHQPSKAKILGERDKARVRVRQNRSSDVRPNTVRTSSDVRPLRSKKEEVRREAKASMSAAPTTTNVPSPDVVELCQQLATGIKANDPKSKVASSSHRWEEDMRLLVRDRDGDVAEIARVIGWCASDDFEKKVVLSPGKLRKRFTSLLLKSQKSNVTALRVAPGQKHSEGQQWSSDDVREAYEQGGLEAYQLASRGHEWRHLIPETEGAA